MSATTNAGAYEQYLQASERHFGALAIGQLGVRGGKVYKKLSREEFDQKLAEFNKLEQLFKGLVNSGATVDDGIYHEVQTLAAELLLEPRGDSFSW